MSLLSFLREADFITTIAVNSAVLCFSFVAYRRCRLNAFAFLIWASVIGIIMSAGLRMVRTTPQRTLNENLAFFQFYRTGYIIASLLGAAGLILLIRHVIARVGEDGTSSPADAHAADER